MKLFHKTKYYLLFLFGLFNYSYSVIFSKFLSFELFWTSVFIRVIFLILALFIIIQDKTYKSIEKKYFIIFLFFWSLLLFRIVYDTSIYQVSLRFIPIKYYAFALGVSFIPSVAFIKFEKKINPIVLGKSIVAFVFPIMLFVSFFEPYTKINNFIRLGSHSFHPIMIGHIAVTNLIVSFFLVNREDKILNSIVLLSNILVSLIVLFKTQSRGPQLAFLIVLFTIILPQLINFKSFLYKKRTVIVLGILFLVSIYFIPILFERLQFTFTNGDTRFLQWKLGILQFYKNPILGSGLEIPKYNIYPHNIFIEGFMATGLLGGLVFLYLIIKPLILAVKSILSNKERLFSALFLQYFVASMFSGSIIFNFALWYFAIIIISRD